MTLLGTNPKFQAFDNNGDPLVGGKLYTYDAGTTTAKITYSNSGLTVANSNPVILDSRGEAVIYLGTGSYKFVLKDANDASIWTVDAIDSGAAGFSWYPFAQDTGTANNYQITVPSGPAAYAAGQIYIFNPLTTNTSVSTLNVNGLGAKTIYKHAGSNNLASGNIQANSPVMVVYSGSYFNLLNPTHFLTDNANNTKFGFPEKVRISYDGRIGVGLTVPPHMISVEKAAAETAVYVSNPQSGGLAAVRLSPNDTATNGDLVLKTTNGSSVLDSGLRDFYLKVGTNNRITVSAAGVMALGNPGGYATGYGNPGDITMEQYAKIRALNTPKFWINFNGNGTVTSRQSFNVSSITDNGVGDYTINLTAPLTNTDCICVGSAMDSAGTGDRQISVDPQSVSTIRVISGQTASVNKYDARVICIVGYGA